MEAKGDTIISFSYWQNCSYTEPMEYSIVLDNESNNLDTLLFSLYIHGRTNKKVNKDSPKRYMHWSSFEDLLPVGTVGVFWCIVLYIP